MNFVKKNKKNINFGFSLLELILAIAIFSLSSYALTVLLIDSGTSTRLSQERIQALFYAKEGMEVTRSIRDSLAWSGFADGQYGLDDTGGTWSFSETPDLLDNKYTRTVNISSVSSSSKEITVTVEWNLTSTRVSNVVLETILTNWIGVNSWDCGAILTDERDAKTYTTSLIGTECWMSQNLNVGTLTAGINSQGTSSISIDKYCYDDSEANCDIYGGLYQWDQMMCGSSSCNGDGEGQPACDTPVLGICPEGWHIPSHYEFTALERAVCTSGSCVTDFPYDETTTGETGTDEGTTLKDTDGLFKGLLAGFRHSDGLFYGVDVSTSFWLSFHDIATDWAWRRYLDSSRTVTIRNTNTKSFGFSVRCLKD